MGYIYADIEILNSGDAIALREGKITEDQIKKIKVKALVDSGAYMLCINENIKNQLNLTKIDYVNAEMADGRIEKVEVAGPVDIRFKTRSTSCRAAVLPGNSEVLLGSIPLEDMDIIILPRKRKLDVPSERPYIAKTKIK
ncbi:Clan AA aspartic protease [Candidatus Magnetomoraceae bacterium gMMP-15]